MPVDPSAAIGAGIGILGGLSQALIGGIGAGRARKDSEKAIEAIKTYTADPEIQKMLAMRKARLGMGLGATTKQLALQGIGTSAAAATRAAGLQGKGAALSTIGAVQKQSQRGYQQLAAQEEAAQEESRRAYERAGMAASAERARQFQSEQEKQQLKANIELEKLAARRAMLSQGLQGLTMAGMSLVGSDAFYKKPTPETPKSTMPFLSTPRNLPSSSILTTSPYDYARSMGLSGQFKKPISSSQLLDKGLSALYR